MIKIGISSCLMYPDPSRLVFGPKTLLYLESDMADYVCQDGVLPVLIPNLPDSRLQPILDELDGFVFQGGNDLAPQTYGEEPILDGRWKGDAVRDAYEIRILDYAMKLKRPVLGICRGFQLMNAYFGGTLFQDIAAQRPGSLLHRDAERYDKVIHSVKLTEGGLLEQLYGKGVDLKVNSVHHQGVRVLGKDLKVLATAAEDGLIEAFEHTPSGTGRVIGVQWHPEFSHKNQDGTLSPSLLIKFFLSQIKQEKYANH